MEMAFTSSVEPFTHLVCRALKKPAPPPLLSTPRLAHSEGSTLHGLVYADNG